MCLMENAKIVIRSLSLGAGEPCFLPQQFRTHKPIASPIEYTHLWVSEVAGQFQGGVCEVSHLSWDLGTSVTRSPPVCRWESDKGSTSEPQP